MYHLGTAAFGSLIIAVIRTIRSVLAYIQKHAKASKSKVVEYLICVLQCCTWCLEKCAKFVNKNAYIQTSIYGFSFCKSSRRAFFLILRNIIRIAVVNAVADFVLLLGKVCEFESSMTTSISVFPTSRHFSP
jgi:solute carrier family 44 (choline transporter-like protein), member 2/4/5